MRIACPGSPVDLNPIYMATLAQMQDEIELIRQAKNDLLLGGQSYGLGDRRFQGVSFDQLVRREKELDRAISFAGGQYLNAALTDVSCAE